MAVSSVKGKWALILGVSSGFGASVALKLSELGMNILGVHLDRKDTMPKVKELKKKIEAHGTRALFYNVNAADKKKREFVLNEAAKEMKGPIHCLLHSLAFGTLRPFLGKDPRKRISEDQVNMTLNVMAHSLIYWTQDLCDRNWLQKGGRVFAMTSSGSARVWLTYGAVSAAKSALESHCRQLAFELAPKGITVNAIRAGITDTPALKKIPEYETMLNIAKTENPSKRVTLPEDVANAISLLVQEESVWLTGNVIGVDGGEFLVR